MAEYAVIIDRMPGAPTVGAFAADPEIGVNVIRDASASDADLLVAFREALDFHFESLRLDGLPVPNSHLRVATVVAEPIPSGR